MVKKTVLFILLLILSITAAASCAVKISPEGNETPGQTEAGTISPSAAVSAADEPPSPRATEPSYSVEGSTIVRDGSVIYDASEYYEMEGKTVSAGNLIVDDDALYFTEYCAESDDSDSENDTDYSIISTDKDGKDRRVITSMGGLNGYSALVEYKDRLFYVVDGFDSVSIGDIGKDGIGQDTLDLAAYADEYDIEPYFSYANLSVRGDYLYAEVGVFQKDGTLETHFLKVDGNLNIERIPPEEDMFTSEGARIYKTPAGSFDRELIYDATGYYEDGTAWVSYLQYDETSMYFAEEGTPKGETGNKDFIIRTDRDGGNRQVLYFSAYNEDIQPCLFAKRLFYSVQWIDYTQIRYMNKDGSGDSTLDLSEYALKQGLDSNYQSVSLYVEADCMHAQVKFNTKDGQSFKWLSFKIDKNLNVELEENGQ